MAIVFNILKSITSYQLLRIAEVNGSRRSPGSPTPLPNHSIDPLGDNEGRVYVRIGTPAAGNIDDFPFLVNAGGYVETFDIGPAQGTFWINAITGFNANAAVRFVQIFVLAPAAPVLNDIPTISIIVAPNTNYSIDFGLFGIAGATATNHLWVVSSITGDFYTPSGTPDLWINIRGRSVPPNPP